MTGGAVGSLGITCSNGQVPYTEVFFKRLFAQRNSQKQFVSGSLRYCTPGVAFNQCPVGYTCQLAGNNRYICCGLAGGWLSCTETLLNCFSTAQPQPRQNNYGCPSGSIAYATVSGPYTICSAAAVNTQVVESVRF